MHAIYSERGNQARIARAAAWTNERAASCQQTPAPQHCRLRAREDGSGFLRAIRACDVRAADLQPEPTKRVENRAGPSDTVVSSDSAKTAATRRTSQRAERANRRSERKRAEQSSPGVDAGGSLNEPKKQAVVVAAFGMPLHP